MSPLALDARDLALLRGTFQRFPCVHEVRVFGSRAMGRASRTSDIDLAVSAPTATPEEWSAFTEALDQTPIIYEFDLVRPEFAHNSRLVGKIDREGVTIYPVPTP